MKKHILLLIATATALLFSCTPPERHLPDIPNNGDDPQTPDIEKEIVTPDPDSGISFEPATPNADQELTIYFRPVSGTSASGALYDCTTDLYAHIGLYYDGDWTHVGSTWGIVDDAKYKFEKISANEYKLKLSPTIREYFNSGTDPVEMIAIVIRNADGSLQTSPDQFQSVTDDKYQSEVFVPDAVVTETMPEGLKHGINYNSDGSVTLVLYDKSKSGKRHDYAYVIGEFSNWQREKEYMMKRDNAAGCWWYTMTDVDPNKEYMFQYHVGEGSKAFRIPDATSEIIYDPWNDKYISSSTYPGLPSYPNGTKDLVGAFQVKRPSYNWNVTDFKIKDENSLVIYELLLRDFTSSKDIPGALEKLDYIQSLGVNAIELMPIQEFDGNLSWGYNPMNYFALDKAYGSRELYKQFVDECHKRNLAVIIDVVYNHTTGSHPFAKLWWDDSSNNVSSENPLYNVTTPHQFGVFHDINHMEPLAVEHIERSLEHLLTEYKVDGFRFDLTKGFTNNSGTESKYDAQRVGILKEYGRFVKSVNPNAMVIFEHFVDAENTELGNAGLHVWGNNNGSYTNIVHGSNADLSYMYDATCTRVGYMESHDEERLCYGVTATASSVSWGICGTLTSWGSSADITLTADGDAFVARNVSFSSSDMFKIRGNSSWSDAYNFGAESKGYKLPLNKSYSLTLGSSSQDMAAPAEGTYDIWFSPGAKLIWVMTPGQKPSDIPSNSESDDKLDEAMRRAALAAAYSMLVPGPKMIWQFGELGYDISIEEGDRTGEKPVKWEYLDVPQRKALHDTYASLLKFRNENQYFFTKGAGFKWSVGTSNYENGKFIYGEAAGKHFCVMGNFGKSTKTISISLPVTSKWYDYSTKELVVEAASYSQSLLPGEFRVLVDFK